MIWIFREGGVFIFRIRRRLQNELTVFRIPMRHALPLRYEFMTKLRNMLPEALSPGGDCVIRQLHILLKDTAVNISKDFDQCFKCFVTNPPYDGRDWRDVGVSTDVMVAFAELRQITLSIFLVIRRSDTCKEETYT